MDSGTIYLVLYQNLLNFSHSATFLVIKIFLGIYVFVVFYDLILILIIRGVRENLREFMSGANVPVELTRKKRKMKLRWSKIKDRLKSGNEADYKVAIIEADGIIEDLLRRMGYKGENMGERLEGIPIGQLEGLKDMKEAHEIRNRIIHENKFQVSREFAIEIIGKYEHLLKAFEVLD